MILLETSHISHRILMAMAFMFGVAISFMIVDYHIKDALIEWEEIKEWCEVAARDEMYHHSNPPFGK